MMTIDQKVRLCRNLGLQPHAMCKTTAGVLWEAISYPFAEGGDVMVMARIPGDPTTLRAVQATLLHPGEPPCSCARWAELNGGDGDFWYRDPAWMAERRVDEVAAWEVRGVSRKATAP